MTIASAAWTVHSAGGECADTGECNGEQELEIEHRKKIDLAIVTVNLPISARNLRKHANRLAFVTDVDGAVKKIKAVWRRINRNNLPGSFVPIENVLLDGHGSPGNQRIGKELIGNRDENAQDAQDDFMASVALMIKKLTLFGCQTAKGDKGQAFLRKLKAGLQAQRVKGYTGIVVARRAVNKQFVIDGVKKKTVPTVSEWGLIIMALLGLTAGTIVFARRRRPAVA